MGALCLYMAIVLTGVLCFVSYVQLLYLESLRLLRRETRALEFFRETLMPEIGLEQERGSLSFSLIKHILLVLIGVLYLCGLERTDAPRWENSLEASGIALCAMLVATYLIPYLLYRRVRGEWLEAWLPAIRTLAFLVTPVVGLVNLFQSVLIELDPAQNGEPHEADAAEDIDALITAGEEEGILAEEDSKLIQSVVAFGDKSIREVMTPRPNIVAISADRSIEDLRQLVIHEQFSRIPVYHDSIDDIIGFIHVRDIFELDPEERQTKPLKELIRPIPHVPETKPGADVLREMQRDGSHMVVVVDEYGNTAGLATMEDLVEEILGEIRDEHEPERDVKQVSENVFIAPGSLDLDRLKDLFNFRPDGDTESTTVGGLVAEWLGHVPQVGETAEHGGIRIEVLAGNERRVEEVKISRAEAAPVGAAS